MLRRAGLAAGLALVAGLTLAFVWQDRIASFGDDSASYLVLAHYFAGSSGNAFAAQWAPYHSHFPPLFPLLLWISGGMSDLRIAYGLVAAFAVLSLPLIYKFARMQLGSDGEALIVTLLWLVMPTAWITLKGIMSESLYLFMAMACVVYFEARIEKRETAIEDQLAFGTLLALACLSRALGITLVLAYLAHGAIRVARGQARLDARRWIALAPVAALLALWYAFRPSTGSDAYRSTAHQILDAWMHDPAGMLATATGHLASGWIASFAVQPEVSIVVVALTLGLGVLALAGVALRVVQNRFDGWFLLFSLAILFPWVFSAENTRRLLYPLIPLLIVCAAAFLRWAFEHARLRPRAWPFMAGFVAALPVVACVPALVLVAQKSMDREPAIPGYAYTYREMAEYYTTVNIDHARDRAKLAVVTLGGLESIDRETPQGARVMWMRPEYVALLGKRAAVPFLYRWDAQELARQVKASATGYIIQAWLSKTDIEVNQGDAHVALPYAHPSFQIGGIFELMQVDPKALDAYIAGSREKQ
jgi:hypothetical protein